MVARFAGDGGGLLEPPYPRMTQIPDMTIKFSSIILWDIYSQYVKKKVEKNSGSFTAAMRNLAKNAKFSSFKDFILIKSTHAPTLKAHSSGPQGGRTTNEVPK